MKFKLFPELTDILLCERYETSGGYWHKHKLERAVDSLKIHPTSYQIPQAYPQETKSSNISSVIVITALQRDK